jgi:hypothetical protein
MGAGPSEHADFTLHFDDEAVTFSDPAFPNVPRNLHFFDIQGCVPLVAERKLLIP